MDKSFLITGAAGFVGSALATRLHNEGARVIGTSRNQMESSFRMARVPSFSIREPLSDLLKGIDVVVHCAARVHVMEDTVADPLQAYRITNVEETLSLARHALEAGVKRFVYISSIKVNGEQTQRRPFTENDLPAPQDPYGVSKFEAEEALRELSANSGLEVVIIRPPLVYGPRVKANFRKLMDWVNRGIPLPLGAIHNKRSMVALGNLIDLITTCIEHPVAANQTFLVSDGEDLSTSDLLRRMGSALGKPARLLPVPPFLLVTGAAALGKRDIAQRLCGSLQVDISKTKTLLGWQPPVAFREALKETADSFLLES